MKDLGCLATQARILAVTASRLFQGDAVATATVILDTSLWSGSAEKS
jgi:hypothetical protein